MMEESPQDKCLLRQKLWRCKEVCLAIPGKIIAVDGDELLRTAQVSFGGVVRQVSLAYVPDATVGDYVIVHVGFAISKLDPAEAQHVFTYLQEIGDLGELDENRI